MPLADAASAVPLLQGSDQVPSPGKGLGQLRLAACRGSPTNRSPDHPQPAAGLTGGHKRGVLPLPLTAHAWLGPGHTSVLWGNFLGFLIITGN